MRSSCSGGKIPELEPYVPYELYQFLILWLAGMLITGFASWRSKNPAFIGFTGILATLLGYFVTFEGIQFQTFVTIDSEVTRHLITISDSATLFLGWASFAIGLVLLVISLYYLARQLYKRMKGFN